MAEISTTTSSNISSANSSKLSLAIYTAVKTRYDSLPNRGKPPRKSSEWTVLAGIVAKHDDESNPWVVSLGTGSKCCGPAAIDEDGGGKVLHDSHAEVRACD